MKLSKLLYLVLITASLIGFNKLTAATTPSNFDNGDYHCYAPGGGNETNEQIFMESTASVKINGVDITGNMNNDYEIAFVYTYEDRTVTPSIKQKANACTNSPNYINFTSGNKISFSVWEDDNSMYPNYYTDGYTPSEKYDIHIYDVDNDKIYTIVTATFSVYDYYTSKAFFNFISSLTVYVDAEIVYPTDNAVQIPTAFDLEWTKTDGCDAYEVQLATDDAFSDLVVDETISSDATLTYAVTALLNNKHYYWRVRSKVGTEYTPWDAGEFLTALPTPTITTPINNFTGFPLTGGQIVFPAVTGADEYIIIVMDGSTEIVNVTDVTASPYTLLPTLNPCTTYDVTIQAKKDFDTSTNYSEVSDVTTFTTVPGTVTLGTPVDNAVVVSILPTFSWDVSVDAMCATTTTLEILNGDDDVILTKNIPYTSGTTVSYTLVAGEELDYYTTYKWVVTASTEDGSGAGTAYFTFTTGMDCPTNVVPADDAVQVVLQPTFSWDAVNGAVSYNYWFGPNEDGTASLISGNTVTPTFAYTTDLAFETEYFWGVNPVNTDETKVCPVYSFISKMDTPIPGFPADGASCIALADAPGFQWSAFAGADSYDVEFKLESQSWDDATIATSSTTNLPYAGLDRDAIYEWRIQANKGLIPTGWSLPNTFYTIIEPVVLLTVADGEFGATTSAYTLTWEAVNQRGATVPTYSLEVSSSTDFTTGVITNTTTNTTFDVNGLVNGTQYFWRVTSDECGSDDVAEAAVWSFTVIPDAPVLASPADASTEVSTWGSYSFNVALGAAGYQIQADDDSDFSSPLVDEEITVTSLSFNNLESSTQYFWKVRAYQVMLDGTKVYGAWSLVFDFTTKALSAPQIAHPLDYSNNILLDILLEWHEVAGAAYYGIQVSKDPTFGIGNLIIDEPIVYDEYQDLSDLDYGTKYFWRLYTAIDNGGGGYELSAWSKAYEFTTIPEIVITGDVDVCSHEVYYEKTYTTQLIPLVKYTWTVTGGTVVDDGTEFDNSVTVKWDTPGTGVISVTRSANHWQAFSDSKDMNVEVAPVVVIDLSTTTTTYFADTYCANERIGFVATLNEITVADLVDYWWDFGDGVHVNSLETANVWEEAGTYTVTFYALTDADNCGEYTETMEITVVNTCPIVMSLDNGNDVCKGSAQHEFELYIFGGDGGDVETEYTYSWTPAYKFLDATIKNAVILNATTNRNITVYAWDRINTMGTLNFTLNILDKPVPDLKTIRIVPFSHANTYDLENEEVATRVLYSYGSNDLTGWTINWYDRTYTVIADYNEVALPVGINKFYLQVENEAGCKSNLKRTVIYRKRKKGVVNHDLITGANGSAFLYAYPNPAVNYLHLFTEFENPTNANISIVDMNGKTVKTLPSTFGASIDKTIDVSSMTVGVYFIVVETNDDTVIWRFIKQ